MAEERHDLTSLTAENAALRQRIAALEAALAPAPASRWTDTLDLVSMALENAPCGSVVASTSQAGPILYVNHAFTRITGYTLAEVPTVGDWIRRAYPDPDYREEVLANWDQDLADPARDVVYRVRCQDGSDKALLLKAGLLPQDMMVVTLTDVTAREEAIAALRESEGRFRTLADTLPTALVVHAGGRVMWANRAAARLAEVTQPEVLVGRDVFSFVHPDSLEVTKQRIASLYAKTRDAAWIDSRFQRADGSPFYVEVASGRIDWRGQPAALVLFNDITARRQAEEERRALEARVQEAQRNESLAVLAGGVAHDFNNLLVGILGNADLALMDLAPESPARANLEGVELAARRAADLARQMLAYSGKGRFVIDRLDLNTLLQEISHLMEANISKKAVLNYHLARSLPAVRADATQLRQVVMNLITNAAEAIGEHSGVITISTGVMECDGAYLDGVGLDTELPAGTYTYLEVSDTGCGMDDVTRARIFEPFFTTKFTGRGLGLAAVRGIVKGHKGAIKVYSEAGRGSTFKVLFPASPDDLRRVAVPEGEPTIPAHSQATVLLVDDEQTVRVVGAAMLRHGGYDVITARDGRAAVDLFASRGQEIDCVLLDLSMPQMDGQETFRELRRLRADVRVVLTSGYNEQDAVNRFAGKGLAGFIQKPYRAAELLAAIAKAIQG
ncbi:MAG: PAS domain S-box protein [Pseudomonadota bacterium]